MYRTRTYPGVSEFNEAGPGMSGQGFAVRSVDYGPGRVSVPWYRNDNYYTFKNDGTLADGWVRAKFVIRAYESDAEFHSDQMLGFATRDVRHAVDGLYVLWYASLYPARAKEPDAVRFAERWRRSPRFREFPVCPHRRRRFYLGECGMDCLCALCGESLTWNEAG